MSYSDILAVDNLGIIGYIDPLFSSFDNLVRSAGGVLYYDARKDLITANGITPDRSGKGNDITWTNFAGTSVSGLVIEDGKVFRRLDGADDFGGMISAVSTEITASPLAIFAIIKVATGSGYGWIVNRNLDNHVNTQFGLDYDPDNDRVRAFLEGTYRDTSVNGSVLENQLVSVGYIWNGTTVQTYVNLLPSGTPGTFSGTLTSQPNINVGRRNPANNLFKGAIAILTIYAGVQATEANVLKAEKALSRAYIGV